MDVIQEDLGDSGGHAAGLLWIETARHRGMLGQGMLQCKDVGTKIAGPCWSSRYLTLRDRQSKACRGVVFCRNCATEGHPQGIPTHGHVPSHPSTQADWSAPSTQLAVTLCRLLLQIHLSLSAKLFNHHLFFFSASLHLGSSHHDGR